MPKPLSNATVAHSNPTHKPASSKKPDKQEKVGYCQIQDMDNMPFLGTDKKLHNEIRLSDGILERTTLSGCKQLTREIIADNQKNAPTAQKNNPVRGLFVNNVGETPVTAHSSFPEHFPKPTAEDIPNYPDNE